MFKLFYVNKIKNRIELIISIIQTFVGHQESAGRLNRRRLRCLWPPDFRL